jgi:hypothetical protein
MSINFTTFFCPHNADELFTFCGGDAITSITSINVATSLDFDIYVSAIFLNRVYYPAAIAAYPITDL